MFLLCATAIWLYPNAQPTKKNSIELASLREQCEQLIGQVDLLQQRIEQLETITEHQQMLNDMQLKLALNEKIASANQVVNETAFIILHQADRKHQQLGLIAEAAADYRNIMHRYPNSKWATSAKHRLDKLETATP